MGGVKIFAGEQFPTNLSAGALTVKEATKARLNLVPCGQLPYSWQGAENHQVRVKCL